ncbi:MAG: Dabb family protein [Sphingobacteriales bacterium]
MKPINRKEFLTTTATLTAGAAVPVQLQTEEHKKQLVHDEFFWLKNPGSVEDRNKLVEGVKSLANIGTIRKLHVGIVGSTEKREVVNTSWGVSELLFFDNEAGQKIYQDHPIHQVFIKNYSHLWVKVVVYDAVEV